MAQPQRDIGLATWALLLRTHAALVSRLERELDEAQRLPLAWYDVLLELNAAEGRRLRMQELGGRVVLSRSRVSRIVDEMVRADLVRREPDPADGRGSYAVLTDAGRAALRAAAPVYLHGIADHFTRHLSDGELRTMHDALSRVLEAAEPSQTGSRSVSSPRSRTAALGDARPGARS